ncbi:MAG: hypothetical protein O2857_22020, partial [Planctomycetota bacterium]|nr:hypothetical protein [Planctomycetota bacterium]
RVADGNGGDLDVGDFHGLELVRGIQGSGFRIQGLGVCNRGLHAPRGVFLLRSKVFLQDSGFRGRDSLA